MATKPTRNPATHHITEKQNVPCCGGTPGGEKPGDTHDGTLVGLSNDALVILTKDDRQHSFQVAKDAYVCCDGVICGIEKLQIGGRIRVTAHANDKNEATIIESLVNNSDFADHH